MPTSSRVLHEPWRSHRRRPDDRHPALPCRRLDARPLACAERQGGSRRIPPPPPPSPTPWPSDISTISAATRSSRWTGSTSSCSAGSPSCASRSRKSDQAVEDYRRSHDLYKSAGSGVTAQQLNELNTQLTAAQTAKAEAESRLNEAQEMRKGGLNSESVPEVLRSPLIAVLKEQLADFRAQDRRAVRLLRRAPSRPAQRPRRGGQHPGPGGCRGREDRRWPGPRGPHRQCAIRGACQELRDPEKADGRRERPVDPARIARARCDGQPQSPGGDAAARQAEHRAPRPSCRPTPSWSRRPPRPRRRAIRPRR